MSEIKIANHAVSRRRVLQAGAATAGIAGFPYFFVKAYAQSDPKVLRLYNWDGSFGEFFTKHWIDPFVKKMDIKVEVIRIAGSRLPMEKVQAQIQAGRPETDFLPMHGDQVVFAKRNNLVMQVPPSAVPEYANIYPEFATEFGPRLVLWCYGLAYNTQKVSPAPTSWKALWDKKFAGKVAINETLRDQTLQMVNLAFKGKPHPVDAVTFNHLTALRPSLVSLWNNGADAEQLFRTGEIVMSPFWNGRVTTLKREGLPIEFAVPDEGFFVRATTYGVPRNARNPELAFKWLNFICTKEPQQAMVEYGYGTPNKLVQYTPEQAKSVIVADPSMVKKVVPEDFELILDKTAEWTGMWTKWKAG